MDYNEAIGFIGGFSKSGAAVSDLSRTEELLKELGNPQHNLEFVHIAGTNGKGSVLEMISESLISEGKSVGQFTSPFISVYEDRIRINGECIGRNEVAYYAGIVHAKAKRTDYSQFEISLAIALLWFCDKKPDIVCLEVGVGGLLDATNIIERPRVAVIASISLDHTAILGKTEAEIAVQKAGIIKHGSNAVLSPQNNEEVVAVVGAIADSRAAELIIPQKPVYLSETSFEYKNEIFTLAMSGAHQHYNAVTAIDALRLLKVCDSAIHSGLKRARVKARFETLSLKPAVIFDGAHNPGAALMLRETVNCVSGRKIGLAGMLKTKDSTAYAQNLGKCFDVLVCTDGFMPDAVPRSELAEIFACCADEIYMAKPNDALLCAKLLAGKEGTVIAFGSLYLYSSLFPETA